MLEEPGVVVTEVVQMEDDRDDSCPRSLHQLEARGMAAIGEQDIGPEPIQDLLGQVEEDGCLTRVR